MAVGFAGWGNDLYSGRRAYPIVARRRLWFAIGAVLVAISAILLVKPGLNPGIEFRGGSEFVISDTSNPSQQVGTDTILAVAPDESPKVTNVGDKGVRIQTARLTTDEVTLLVDRLAVAYDVPAKQISTSYIGPTWGADVSRKAVTGIVVFLFFVAVVMTLYFRNWQMAVAAIVALFHDLAITVGVYAAVGFEVTPATVIGFLTILGYSMYDTVVVFDKVRENTADTLDQRRYTYAEKANLAVNQTLVRSINTSVVALLPVAAILLVGAVILKTGTLRDISLALFVGIAVGAFSSIFLATPLQVTLRELDPAIRDHTAKVLADRTGEDQPVVVSAGQLRPGSHQGLAAQPKRKNR